MFSLDFSQDSENSFLALVKVEARATAWVLRAGNLPLLRSPQLRGLFLGKGIDSGQSLFHRCAVFEIGKFFPLDEVHAGTTVHNLTECLFSQTCLMAQEGSNAALSVPLLL